ncbi:MAG: cysteine peptidase family C39 domain-containing protein [Bacteroidales bacterium]
MTREGVSFLGLSEAAESIGMRTIGVRIPFSKLKEDVPLPCIAHWRQNHFVVVYRIKGDRVYLADPAIGKVVCSVEEFERNWAGTIVDDVKNGLVMILQPTPCFMNWRTRRKTRKGSHFSSGM